MRTASMSRNSRRIAPYLFVLPFLLALVFVYAYPLVETVLMSFQKVKLLGTSKWVGLKNYQNLFQPQFLSAIKNSFVYTASIVATEVPLALLLALTLNRATLPGRNGFRSVFFVPVLTSTVIGGVLFRLMFGGSATSLFNSLLLSLGIIAEPINWLFSTEGRGIFVLVMVSLWRATGLNMVFFLSALQSVPADLYEAARIDGAGRLASFRYVTLPGIRPTFLYIITMVILNGFSMFAESYTLWVNSTVGNIGVTIVRYLYSMGFYKSNFGMASAVGIVLLALVAVVNLVQLKVFGLFKEE